MTTSKNSKKKIKAYVVKKKMDKSILVHVKRTVQHPLYKKYVRKTTKLQVHDEVNECFVGDLVEIQETRPISKLKSWSVVRILEKCSSHDYQKKTVV
ncbi:30S ribosomal protein S17 [Candidatus Riesia pediculicola]|uniref:Small ribosomal subunit protein uS17 n=1 Tax=Riesia pediculicola (strain USDA) TaxID=515618 RepID=D4G8M5_RIEPU|nr:30S ribosomal protein S17 [Candidatus Riesia pediculicola]ADD79910.1 ribosomal protein S17 [Candidatus Riesia pediculicola USDA]QOJ86534.1 30S ribosomal protein S17 [Candidatus Riesia pediculicola]